MVASGAALATYNNSFEQSIALVTAGSEIMTNKSAQVARGLNTIAARISKNEKLLGTYGIALYDTEGQMRSTFDILSDLADIWQTLSDAEQVSLGQELAGINQYKVFSAVIGNFNTALKSEQTALSSVGSAAKENSKYMESIEAHTAKFNSAFAKLSNDLIKSDIIKFFIDLGTALLKVADTGIGRFTIKTTALGVVLGGLPLLIIAIVNGIKNFAVQTINSTKNIIAETLAIKANTAAKKENAAVDEYARAKHAIPSSVDTVGMGQTAAKASAGAGMGAAAVGAAAFFIAGIAMFAKSAHDYATALDTIEESIASTSSKVQEVQGKLRELEDAGMQGSAMWQVYSNQLEAYNQQLDRLKKQKIEEYFGGKVAITSEVRTVGTIEEIAQAQNKLTEAQNALNNAEQRGETDLSAYVMTLEEAQKEYDYLSSTITIAGETTSRFNDRVEELNKAKQIALTTKDPEKYAAAMETVTEIMGEFTDYYTWLAEETENGTIGTIEQLNAYNRLVEVLGIVADETKELTNDTIFNTDSIIDQAKASGMAQSEIVKLYNAIDIFNRTNLDPSQKMGALSALANAAQGASLQFIQSILTMYKALAGDRWGIMAQTDPTAIALLKAAAEAKSIGGLSTGYGYTGKGVGDSSTSGGSISSGGSSSSTDTYKEAFDKEYNALKHNLTMEYISEKQYYDSLEKLYKKYFAGKSEYQDDYWQYEEEVYKGRKKLEEDLLEQQKQSIEDYYDKKIDALQQTNDELSKEYDLQQALLALEQARQKRLLVYDDGKFRYIADYEAIASASQNVQNLQRQAAIDALQAQKEAALSKYANGTTFANGGLSLVGEKGAELRVLNRGDGIISSRLTSNLMELGKYTPRELMSGGGQFVFNGALMFPNVTNTSGIENFVNGVKQLAYQKAYERS